MFTYISIPKFADSVMENNNGQYKRADLIKALEETLQAKKNGVKCIDLRSAYMGGGQRNHRHLYVFHLYHRRSRRQRRLRN